MIPTYDQIMLPFLESIKDGGEHSLSEVHDTLAEHFKLSGDEINKLLPSGQQPVFRNRVSWAKTHLKKAGLLLNQKRGLYQISDEGLKLLEQKLEKLSPEILMKYSGYSEFSKASKSTDKSADEATTEVSDEVTPEEELEYAYQRIKSGLTSELMSFILDSSPSFFEKLVIDLLIKMGYGGSRKDAGEALGKTGDGGIDGSIKEDRLGLDTIYVQAKRWTNNVPIKEIRDFAGALLSKKARKGIFITTSGFPRSVVEYVNSIEPRIILIDGDRLTDLMYEYSVGFSTVNTYDIKRIDSDYFEET